MLTRAQSHCLTQQPSLQPQNRHHTLNLFHGFYGSVKSFPSNLGKTPYLKNPQDTQQRNGVHYVSLKHMLLCHSSASRATL